MWTVINGFDCTGVIPPESMQLSQTVDDPQAKAQFDVDDQGSQLSFSTLQEVIIWDEASGLVPAHNLIVSAHNLNTSPWIINNNNNLSTITYPSPDQIHIVAPANNLTAILQNILPGYTRPGQTYTFSAFITTPGLPSGSTANMSLQFLDNYGVAIPGTQQAISLGAPRTNVRFSVSGVAPSNAYSIVVQMGVTTTSSGGTVTWADPQIEMNWFAGQGISYPTPLCNYNQASAVLMPDGTASRQCRLYSGYISDMVRTYEGKNRTWQIQCAGPGACLEDGLINGAYTNQYDSQIISSVISTFFSGQLSVAAPNSTSPAPLVQGALIDSVSYNDNTLKDVMNGMINQSGNFTYFVDQYYSLHYQPQYYTAATWTLSDSPNFTSSFSYEDYSIEDDATQIKRLVKIVGGKFMATAYEQFSGNGTTKQFNLANIPHAVSTLTVGGTNQRIGAYGVHLFSSGKYDVLLNKQSQYILFNTAPASGTNNITIIYSYEAPVSTLTSWQGTNTPVSPSYVLPDFSAKVSDTDLLSLAAATQRGLSEIVKAGNPLVVVKLKTDHFTAAGNVVYLTSQNDGLTQEPMVVSSVTGTYLGGGNNLYEYQLGPYQLTFVDHLKHANKKMAKSTTVANVTAPQQIDAVAVEPIEFVDSISATIMAIQPAGTYGSATYGGNKYS